MKLHLPTKLYRRLLTCLALALGSSFSSFGEIPEGYTTAYISKDEQLADYTTQDYTAFILRADINDTAYRMQGSHQYWTCDNAALQRSLISSVQNGFVRDAKLLTVEGLYLFEIDDTRYSQAIESDEINLLHNNNVVFRGSEYDITCQALYGLKISILDNDGVTFSGNKVILNGGLVGTSAKGGAIYGDSLSAVALSNNGDVAFLGNCARYSKSYDGPAPAYGGAIYVKDGSSIILEDNKNIIFSQNSVYGRDDVHYEGKGGAIYTETACSVNVINNENVSFCENHAGVGSGIYVRSSSSITMSENGIVTFGENTGMTIYGEESCSIMLTENGEVSFLNNNSGAICVGSSSAVDLSYNDSVIFSENEVVYSGGAILAASSCAISLTNNEEVTFIGNSTSNVKGGSTIYTAGAYGGGAIYGDSSCEINLSNNGNVTLSGNKAEYLGPNTTGIQYGGAIYAKEKSSIRICGNENTTFRGNYERNSIRSMSGSYAVQFMMRSIYTLGYKMELSAGDGCAITFYDSIYAASSVTVSYNGDYEDGDGEIQKGSGDIIFSGLYTKNDLASLYPEYTETDLTNSLTSEIYSNARLYGGRLIIEDGAIYKGTGLLAQPGNGAQVVLKDGALNLTEDLTISRGTALVLQGKNYVTAANVMMSSGSTLSFTLDVDNLKTAALDISGSNVFYQSGALTIDFSADCVLAKDGAYKLITTSDSSSPASWSLEKVSISGLPLSADCLEWKNGILYLNYTVPVTWTGAFSDVWGEGLPNWTKSGEESAYKNGDSVVFGNGARGTVNLSGTLAPGGVHVDNNASHAYTFAGSGKLTGGMVLLKDGAGTLTINTANDYTGGTTIRNGVLVAGNAAALGTGLVKLSGGTLQIAANEFANTITSEGESSLTIDSGTTLALKDPIANTGTLTIGGAVDATAMTLNVIGTDTHINTSGKSGASGFKKLAERNVQIVQGGCTVGTDAQVLHAQLPDDMTLSLGEDGVARAGGTVDYSNYLVTGTSVARSSTIHAVEGASAATITMESGTLTVDDAAYVTATAGNIFVGGGMVTGALSGTSITISSGTLAAALNGSNRLTGSNYAMKSAVSNNGTLTLAGTFDASAMQLEEIGGTRIDVEGRAGASGFASGAIKRVKVVNGGSTVSDNAIVTHGALTLSVGADGYASTSAVVDYSNYLLTGSDTVSSGAVHAVPQASAATITQQSGALTINDTATVYSTGGIITLSSGALNGTVTSAVINASGGILGAALSGANTLNAANYVLSKVISNTGTLTVSGTLDASALTLESTGEGYVDVSGASSTSGFAKAADRSVTVVSGGVVSSSSTTVKHGQLTLSLDSDGVARLEGEVNRNTYYLFGGDTVDSASIHSVASAATVTMSGGTLTANDTVNVTATGGDILLSGGTVNGSIKNTGVTALSGTVNAVFSGSSRIAGSNCALNKALTNTGTLTMSGSYDASALTLQTADATHVDVKGSAGANGFFKAASYSVTLVTGGTVVNENATVTHGARTLTLGANGVATAGGEVDYSDYLLKAGATVASASIHGVKGAEFASITHQGGTLTVNDTATVYSTGGDIILNDGTLNGTVSGATITAGTGSIYATFGGSNTITGNSHRLSAVLVNTGTLTMRGSYDVSDLEIHTDSSTHIDVNGKSGNSGFAKLGDSTLTVVSGGVVVNGSATIRYGGLNMTLGTDGIARMSGATDYSTYLLTGSDSVSSAAVHGKASSATITQQSGSLTVNDTATVYSTGGTITMSSGALNGTVNGAVINASGGVLNAALSGANTLNGSGYMLSSTISNTGTLTMSGTFNASSLTLTQGEATHVDVNGNTGNSGFAKSGGYSVTLVSGGSTVNNGATITHGNLPTGLELTLGTNGVATAGGTVDYSDYLLTGSDTVATSAIHAKKAGATVTQKGGTLTVDDATTVNTTGGTVKLTKAVTLGGSISNAAVTTSAGTITATMSGSTSLSSTGNTSINAANSYTGGTTISGGTLHVGNKSALGTGAVKLAGGALEIAAGGFTNTITASGNSTLEVASGTTLALSKAISNTGALTMSGTFNASALTLTQGEATHVDVNGNTGNSGFAKSGGYSVTLVSGGSTVNNGATITHGNLPTGLELTLGTNGVATAGGTVDYSDYLLTSSDTVATSAIHAKKAGATVTQKGGTLTVDDATTVNTTGGTVKLTKAVTLGGSISNAAVTASAGTITATMSGSTSLTSSGNVTLSGAKTYTGMTTVNSGTLTLNGSLKSDVAINGGTLNTGSGLTLSSGQDILMNGGSISGQLTTSSGSSIKISPSTATISGSLTLAGGMLDLNDNQLNITGALALTSKTSLVLDSGYGYGDYTIITAGSISGSTDMLSVTGLGGDYELRKQGNSIILSITGEPSDIDFPKNGIWANGQSGYKNGDRVTFTDCGTVTVSGEVRPGSMTVTGSGATTWNGSGTVGGSAHLTKTGSGTLTINTSNSFTGGADIKQGTVSAGADNALGMGAVTMQKGTMLKLNGHNLGQNEVTVQGSATLAAGNGGQVKSLNVATQGGASGQQGELLFGEKLALSGTLKTGSLTLTKGNIEGGSVTVTGGSTVKQGYIATNINGTTLEKTGKTRVEMKGANSFSSGVTVSQGQLVLLEGGSLAGDVAVKNGAALLTGKGVAVNGGITLESGADMHLRPGAVYELTRKLTANSGAEFHGNLATKDGSTLTMGAAAQSGNAFAVHGSLTLGGGSLAYSGSLSKGTTYTLATATDGISNTSGKTLYTLFNLSEAGYTITNTGSAITLQQKANVSQALQRVAVQGVPAGLAVEGEPAEEDGAIVIGSAPEEQYTEAPMTETAVNGVTDAMVQADWGVVQGARAFAGTLNGSHGNLRSLGNGRTAVWANAFGSTTRQSSNRGHAGADHQLAGASLGLETMVGSHGAAGIAIGHTWNRVNTFGMSRLKQDAQHAGVFGRARVASCGTNTVWIEGSASYGKAETRGQLGYSRERWTQNSGTLNARVNDVLQLTESTSVNFYGGLEYLATDSGRIEDLSTGSVQNLRGELGAGITHRIGSGVVFAEAALQGDMVRHNPQTDVGIRQRGANPGRIGGSITVGGAYSLGEHWSVNAAYTFEGAKHNNSHNASVGATYRF